MYKVIISDDHMPMLNYLSANIPWQSLGLELVATCADGEEALEACARHRPDILITDIGMPIMNGLEVIQLACAANPRLKTIILSCHEDFQYAQRAVQLEVSDYVLKESLRIEQITEILKKLRGKLDAERASQREHQQLQDVVKSNGSAIRATFLRSLIEQPIWNLTEWEEKAESIGIHFEQKMPYLPVISILEHPHELEERFGGKHNMRFVLLNGLDELITIDGCVLLSFDERSSLIMFPFPKTISRNLYEEIQLLLKQIQNKMIQYLKTGISFYLGGVCLNLTELKTEAQRILDLGSFRFYAGENCLVKWQAIETTKDDIFVHYANILQSIRNCIVGKDKQLAATTIHHWIVHINHLKYPMEAVQGLVLKLVTEIELKYTVMQSFVTNFNVEQFHRIIYAIETLDHLERWLTQYLEQKITSLGAIKDVSLRKEVAEAKRYVIMNPGKKISMEEMAQRINLNSSHFSRMFKDETGENFISFVTRVKMERAQELLDQSDLTVHEIAEQLGYEHTSYFIKLFRNYSGHSPNEQRRRL
ncbi:helix-turn-helix domain-containing protein [Paenibacillus aceti]|uniref:DNA-binding response regulator n=1 Tax=Paenibacillus aceti TaxID=1820010 RepID=A0ABQ1W6W1_9BACL|nr:helix-turn-helix domain-containing protein [Paenibacillus aceti]GGG17342.1 hypothetical protein GCM10010913_44250 [Paenibacillus aceti]